MALSIVETLEKYGYIDQDFLAQAFARRFVQEPHRGYAGGAMCLLGQVAAGGDWRELSLRLFGGGSFGNGSAMRVALKRRHQLYVYARNGIAGFYAFGFPVDIWVDDGIFFKDVHSRHHIIQKRCVYQFWCKVWHATFHRKLFRPHRTHQKRK